LVDAAVNAFGGADILLNCANMQTVKPLEDFPEDTWDYMLRMLLTLFFCMLASLVLGMGVPTTANYVIMATVTAPIVIDLGIPLLAAHMFVFYFGIVADITPPVALAAYAGASIARSDPMKTGITASRLGIAAFIVPYIFALSPQILFLNPAVDAASELYYSSYPGVFSMIQVGLTAFIGASGIAIGLTGFIKTKLRVWERFLCVAAGLLLIDPGLVTDIIGIVAIAGVFVLHYAVGKKEAA
jgi:TRAP-type uncharacterized transport system fused permease subunit